MKIIYRLFRSLIIYSVRTAIKLDLEFQYDLNIYGMFEHGIKFKSIWIDKKGRIYRIKEYYEKSNRG